MKIDESALAEIAYNVMGEYKFRIYHDSSGSGALAAAEEIAKRYFALLRRAQHDFDADFASESDD